MAARARNAIVTVAVAATLALGACGDDEETTTAPTPEVGATGASGPGGPAQQDAEKPASKAQEEGAGTGLEQDISGADASGTDTEAGQQGTTGDTTAE
jgi:hypothetical protein